MEMYHICVSNKSNEDSDYFLAFSKDQLFDILKKFQDKKVLIESFEDVETNNQMQM